MKRLIACAAVALWGCWNACAQKSVIWFDRPTSATAGAKAWKVNDMSVSTANPDREWESLSLPIGNGFFGASVLGSVERERVVLNEHSLWHGGPATGPERYWKMNAEVPDTVLPLVRRLLLEGRRDEAHALVARHYRGTVDYDRHVFGAFTMLGEAYVEVEGGEGPVGNYRRQLDLGRALATVEYDRGGTHYTRDYFASCPDSVQVWRFRARGAAGQRLTFSFDTPQEMLPARRAGNGLLYSGCVAGNGMKWALRVEARTKGGRGTVTADAARGTLTVSGSDDVEFLLTADTDYRMNFDPDPSDAKAYVGPDPVATTEAMMREAAGKSYARLLKRHEADYGALFGRVDLAINPGRRLPDVPTPERLRRYREGQLDHELERTYFDFGRYLLIASSRPGSLAANLQGLWHNNLDGPWHVDYHNNINVQMNYWPATAGNLLECFGPYVDYIRSLVKPGERTARAYYGARGWTAAISANPFGFTAPLNSGDMSWNYNPVAGGWLTTQIWEYYDYTRDRRWLSEVGYPIIRASADFLSDLLFRLPDGTYTSAPSYSPEHGTADLGATYANAVTREVLAEAVRAAAILQTDADAAAEWQEKLDRMTPYKVGRHGQLQEWYDDIDDPTDRHRHTNHLFGLHPGSSIDPLSTPRLAEACRQTLRQRGDAATGWSMGWKLNHWARLHDGAHAYTLFQNLLKHGTGDNLWDVHPPFQIDGNFGGTAGVMELFLQSHTGRIHLLPALPPQWRDGHIRGLRARGNFEVDIVYAEGALVKATLRSGSGERARVHYRGCDLEFPTVKGRTYTVTFDGTSLRVKG